MIDVSEFERLDGFDLARQCDTWRSDCDGDFVRYVQEHHRSMSPFRFRMALVIMATYDSDLARAIASEYIGDERIDIRTSVNAFFYKQLEAGLITEVPDGVN